jgi:hypothetical protein
VVSRICTPPLAVQVEPAEAVQVQVTPEKSAAKVSVTETAGASLGPRFWTVIV